MTIHTGYQKDIWTVESDKGQIEQVLLNLYVNAWQAMPGGGDLSVKTENVILDKDHVKTFTVKPGNYVKLSVADTGEGMDEETQRRIFEPFFTTKQMGRGTGLGLASAYGIIKSHGGYITVCSEKGEGSTFTLYLPASAKEAVEEKELSEVLLKGNETVLLVDDEEMILETGERILQYLGYKTMVAPGGKEAIETYREKKDEIDLVILDMIMPEMSGEDTYNQLKEINPDIKVLLSSGYSANGLAKKILGRGCNGFIQKPFSLKELSESIRNVIDGSLPESQSCEVMTDQMGSVTL
jgi:CheY-like chemotaxis protein